MQGARGRGVPKCSKIVGCKADPSDTAVSVWCVGYLLVGGFSCKVPALKSLAKKTKVGE